MKNIYIIDDRTKKVLFIGTQSECEMNLTYYLNHEHNAYIVDDKNGYKLDQFTLVSVNLK